MHVLASGSGMNRSARSKSIVKGGADNPREQLCSCRTQSLGQLSERITQQRRELLELKDVRVRDEPPFPATPFSFHLILIF